MTLQRRRELARLSKPQLIDLIVSEEKARTGWEWITEDGKVLRRYTGPWEEYSEGTHD